MMPPPAQLQWSRRRRSRRWRALEAMRRENRRAARPMGPTGPRNGEGASILYTVNGKTTEFSDQRRAIYFDSGGDRIYPVSSGDMQIVSNTPEQAEIMWPGAPTADFNFEPSFTSSCAAASAASICMRCTSIPPIFLPPTWAETRFVLYGPNGQALFDHHIVDDIRQGDPRRGGSCARCRTRHGSGRTGRSTPSTTIRRSWRTTTYMAWWGMEWVSG